MSDLPPLEFLDVHALLERSQPRPRGGWIWLAIGVFVILILASATISGQSREMATVVHVFSAITMIGLILTLSIITLVMVRRARAEQLQLEVLEELVTLRRWPQAAMLLEGMLNQPTRTPAARVQALIYLGAVLARYHRFDDSITV